MMTPEIAVTMAKGTLVNRVSELAGGRRMQIADLAREAKVSYETAKRLWHNETDAIRFETLANICDALQCGVGDLFVYIPDKDRGR
jgi:putative transcriptional regulator